MEMMLKDTGTGFKPAPAGTHLARCFKIVELGVQRVTFQNQTKELPKLQIYFELFGDDDDGNPLTSDDGAPLTISRRFTASLSPKSNLRPLLESWRGRPFSPQELQGFSLRNLLGKFAMVSVVHETVDTKTFANLIGLSGVPSAMRKSLPAGHHPEQYFMIADPDMAMFAGFHEKLQTTIRAALNWKEPEAKKDTGGIEDMPADPMEDDSDIPF